MPLGLISSCDNGTCKFQCKAAFALYITRWVLHDQSFAPARLSAHNTKACIHTQDEETRQEEPVCLGRELSEEDVHSEATKLSKQEDAFMINKVQKPPICLLRPVIPPPRFLTKKVPVSVLQQLLFVLLSPALKPRTFIQKDLPFLAHWSHRTHDASACSTTEHASSSIFF